jgi:hypothetical protein
MGYLDKIYFESHRNQLTNTKYTQFGDTLITEHIQHTNTPFFYPHQIIFILSLIIPLIAVFFLSIKFLYTHISKTQVYFSLLIPATYILINILSFLYSVDLALGWEYTLGMYIVIIESAIVLSLILLINSSILLRHKKNKQI